MDSVLTLKVANAFEIPKLAMLVMNSAIPYS